MPEWLGAMGTLKPSLLLGFLVLIKFTSAWIFLVTLLTFKSVSTFRILLSMDVQ